MAQGSMITLFCSKEFLQPNISNSFNVVYISRSSGTSFKITFLSKSRLAKRIGKAAFFAPLIRILPLRLGDCSIINVSIYILEKPFDFCKFSYFYNRRQLSTSFIF